MKVMMIAAANRTSGGGEKHVADCLREMSARGIELALVAPEGGDLGQLAQDLGVAIYPAPIDHGIQPPRTRLVREAIEDFNPDIVHAHGHRAALFARRADPRAAQRVVYTFHGIHVDKGVSSPAKLRLERMFKPRTAAFIAVSKGDLKKAVTLQIADSARISLVYNGVRPGPVPIKGSFRDELGIAPDSPLALSVARISAPKNLPGLIHIWARTVDAWKNRACMPHLVLIAPGPQAEFDKLQKLIVEQDLADTMTLLPARPSLASAYADADVFALASLWEGLPYVVIESLAAGTPVVSYDLPGCVETIAPTRDGFLIPLRDEDTFAAALVDLLSHPALCKEMGSYGVAQMRDRFSLDTMIDNLLAVYDEVLARNASC